MAKVTPIVSHERDEARASKLGILPCCQCPHRAAADTSHRSTLQRVSGKGRGISVNIHVRHADHLKGNAVLSNVTCRFGSAKHTDIREESQEISLMLRPSAC